MHIIMSRVKVNIICLHLTDSVNRFDARRKINVYINITDKHMPEKIKKDYLPMTTLTSSK